MSNRDYIKYNKYKSKYLAEKQKYIQNLDFPWITIFNKFDKQRFDYLVENFKPVILDYIPQDLSKMSITDFDGKPMIIQENWDENSELNSTTDYFTEECRVKCSFGRHPSPYEWWAKNKREVLEKSKKCRIITKKPEIECIRDVFFKHTKLCNNFRISVALTVLDIFKTKKWLDISAGWGDRLIAAIAGKVELYCGVDPSDCLHPHYRKIIDTLASPQDKPNYILIKNGFENAVLPDVKFDTVFSSPPFFDLEVYTKDPADSLVKYPTSQLWYDKFLLVSLAKAYRYLKFQGHMILYMGESHNTDYIPKMIADVSKYMTYLGIIYYYYPGSKSSPRKLFVWRKD